MRSAVFLWLMLFVIVVGCHDSKPHDNPDPMTEMLPVRFLALGDSYTIGEGVEEAGRWPNQLADTLALRGIEMDKPVIVARTGWTTAELKAGIAEANPRAPFDLVSLLIGVNNQFRGPSRGYTQQDYRTEFADLLQQAIGFAGGDASRVFVVSIPDYGVTPFVAQANKARVAEEIDQYNAINLEESTKAGVSYFNITPLSRLAAEDPSLLAPDRLHPSADMYRLWVELMVEEVAGKVKSEE